MKLYEYRATEDNIMDTFIIMAESKEEADNAMKKFFEKNRKSFSAGDWLAGDYVLDIHDAGYVVQCFNN